MAAITEEGLRGRGLVGGGELAGSGGLKPEAGAEVALCRLAESDLIAVVTATMEGITEANDAFLRLVGYSEAELTAGAVDWQAMTPPEWAPADQAALAELQATGSCTRFRKEYWRKDGSRVPVEVCAVVLGWEPLRWACFIRDTSAEQQAREAAQQAAELAALAAELSQAVTVADVAQALAGWLRRAVGAKLAILVEADPRRPVLRYVNLHDVPDEVTRLWTELDATHDSPAVRAWRGGKPVFFADPQTIDAQFPHLAAARAAAGTGSCLAAPLITGGKVTGVLTATWPEPRQLSSAQHQFLVTVAGYAAQALRWVRQFEAEHAVAHQLQQALLRPTGNADARVEVNAVYRPATTDLEVGGDWYDVLTVTDECMALIVGDVVGHGISAASAMGQLRSALRGLVLAGLQPAAALEALDKFASAVPDAQFATCLVAFLDARRERLTVSVAGHMPPLIIDARGNASFFQSAQDPPLGFAAAARKITSLEFPVGSTIILYTDGLIERRGEPLDAGMKRLTLAATQSGGGIDGLSGRLVRELVSESFRDDDVAVVCARLLSQDPARFTETAPAEPAQVRALRHKFRDWLSATGASGQAHAEVCIAVGEALANCAEHAYAGARPQCMTIEASASSNHVQVTIRDCGHWRPPSGDPARGRGLPLIRKLMDQVQVITDLSGTTIVAERGLGEKGITCPATT
jgi:PAS domain S-box-containing protein